MHSYLHINKLTYDTCFSALQDIGFLSKTETVLICRPMSDLASVLSKPDHTLVDLRTAANASVMHTSNHYRRLYTCIYVFDGYTQFSCVPEIYVFKNLYPQISLAFVGDARSF